MCGGRARVAVVGGHVPDAGVSAWQLAVLAFGCLSLAVSAALFGAWAWTVRDWLLAPLRRRAYRRRREGHRERGTVPLAAEEIDGAAEARTQALDRL